MKTPSNTAPIIARNNNLGPGEAPSDAGGGGFAFAKKHEADLPPLEAAADPSSCWDCAGDNTGGHRGLCVACTELDNAPAVRDARLLSPAALAEAAANTVELGADDDFDDYVYDSDEEQSALGSLQAESIAAAADVDLAADTLSQLHIADSDVASIDRGRDWVKIQLVAPHLTGGYTKIMALNSGLVTGFFADFDDQPEESYPFGPAPKTLLHREDGPAMIDYNTGERMFSRRRMTLVSSSTGSTVSRTVRSIRHG